MEHKAAEWAKTTLLAVLPAAVAGYLGNLAVPFLLLLAANVVDYMTGLAAAPCRGGASSAKGWQGIVKKVLMWLLVVVGALVDTCLVWGAHRLGWEPPFALAFGCLVCLWQFANELISILENVSDAGIKVPGFLMKAVYWVKAKTDEGREEDA
jgi:toxin secretion/phage lysis holin